MDIAALAYSPSHSQEISVQTQYYNLCLLADTQY